MGTWGSGNFANDSAQNYMNDFEDQLVQQIEDILADEERYALEEEGEGVLMPTVEILSVLHEHRFIGLPERETILRWKEQYLAAFDDQIDGFEPKAGYKESRRAVIEATFLKLEAQAWDYAEKQKWFLKPDE